MPILATCGCGKAYNLKDEFAGRAVKCPACGATIVAPVPVGDGQTSGAVNPYASPLSAPAPQAAPTARRAAGIFDRDKFLLRQKFMTMQQRYYVWDEAGEVLLFVERPVMWLKMLGVLILCLVVGLAILFGVLFIAVELGEGGVPSQVLMTAGTVLAIFATLALAIGLSPKRHVTFYRDDTKAERLLEVLQDKRFMPIWATYTVRDPQGAVLAKFEKNYLYNIFRRRWRCFAPDGSLVCYVLEDALVLAILRRFLGTFFGLLRLNFVFLLPDGQTSIGQFNRRFTLLDRYVLDMSADASRHLDRRLAVALGVMLDTGERR